MTTINRRTALAALGGAAALSMPYIRRAHADAGTLNVYNWADYIGETTHRGLPDGHRHRRDL